MAGGLDVDIAAVAVGELVDCGDGIDLAGVDTQVGAAGPGDFKTPVVEIEGDKQARVFQPCGGDHAEPERAAAGDGDGVVELDLGALDGVDSAGQRLDIGGVFCGDGVGHFVVEGIGGQQDVLGHGTKGGLAEAVDVVDLTHPVLAAAAVAATVAGNDLLGDDAVAQGEAVGRGGGGPQGSDGADEFVPGDDRGLTVACAVVVAPKQGRTEVAFEVGGTDADGVGAEEDFVVFGDWYRVFFEAVILRGAAEDGRH